MKTVNIWGLEIVASPRQIFLKEVFERLNFISRPLLIFTPNAENLLRAQKNSALKNALSHADYNIPDSASILWSAERNGQGILKSIGLLFRLPFGFGVDKKIFEKISGADLVMDIFTEAEKRGYKVALVGGAEKAAEEASFNLKSIYPQLNIVYAGVGILEKEWHLETLELTEKLNQLGAEIILCAFGCPKQELWCYYQRDFLPRAKILIGVGGTLEFLSGQIKRAPVFLRKLNLEWLWRLLQQPWRLGRIFNAVAKFIYKDLKN